MEPSLESLLEHTNARNASRVNTGKYLLQAPDAAKKVMVIAFNQTHPLHIKAAWSLEQAVLINPYFLENELALYFKNLPLNSSDSALRSLAKISSLMLGNSTLKEAFLQLPKKVQKQVVSCAFSWLIGPYRVAVQVHAMDCLSRLIEVEDWIKPQLIDWLETNYNQSSAAFQARSRMILKRIKN